VRNLVNFDKKISLMIRWILRSSHIYVCVRVRVCVNKYYVKFKVFAWIFTLFRSYRFYNFSDLI